MSTEYDTPHSNELACTWEELKQRGKQFVEMAPTAKDEAELHGLWDCVALGYLNLTGATQNEQHQAVILLQILGREMIKHEVRLDPLRHRTSQPQRQKPMMTAAEFRKQWLEE